MSNTENILISRMKNIQCTNDEVEEEITSWTLDDFEIGDCLGNGKFGYVYKAIEKKNGKEVAIKVICKKIVSQLNFYHQLKNEIEIHTRLIHDNIVKMFGYFYDNSYVYLVFEYVKKGNLFQYIKSLSRLGEQQTAKFTYDLALSLNYLKKRNIIHRDLKLENVIISENTDDGTLSLKLADFGWACQYFTEKRKTLCGTPEYLAPEMAKDLSYDFGIDMWSLGIITYEMVTGYSPFTGTELEILDKIKNYKNFDCIKKQLDEIYASEELCEFISRLLCPESAKRLQIDEVLIHPWLIKNLSFIHLNNSKEIK